MTSSLVPAVHTEIALDGQRLVVMATGPTVEVAYLATGPTVEVAYLARLLDTLTPLFEVTKPPGALYCPLSWPAVVQLAATFRERWAPGPHLLAWIAEQTRVRVPAFVDGDILVPEGLTAWPHQLTGAAMIAATGRAMIFDEPRTGKTITTVLGLAERQARGKLDGSILVVCPAAVVDPWLEAIEDWAPHWRAIPWTGGDRRALIGTADVYVASYEMTTRDTPDTHPRRSPLIALDPAGVVVDECHMIKSRGTKRSQAVRRVARNAKAFVALSGTPITHHPADLWPTLEAFAPGAWPARERWVGRYCATGFGSDYGEDILGLSPHTEAEFRRTIQGQYRRVARADLGWAPKSYEVREVTMPTEYRAAYDEFEAQMLTELPDEGGELQVMDVLSKMTFLSRLACSAADVEITVGPDVDEQTGELKVHKHVNLRWPSWTVDALGELIAESPATPRVVFADARPLAMMAGEAAEALGLRVGYIVGKQSRKTRTAYRRAFQAGELDLICATVSAGGVGITLNRAEQLVFLQRPWSLVDSIQAEDRGVGDINAPGCHVVDILTRNTIHTRVRAVLRERAGQLADLVQDPRIVAELLGGASVHELRRAS